MCEFYGSLSSSGKSAVDTKVQTHTDFWLYLMHVWNFCLVFRGNLDLLLLHIQNNRQKKMWEGSCCVPLLWVLIIHLFWMQLSCVSISEMKNVNVMPAWNLWWANWIFFFYLWRNQAFKDVLNRVLSGFCKNFLPFLTCIWKSQWSIVIVASHFSLMHQRPFSYDERRNLKWKCSSLLN